MTNEQALKLAELFDEDGIKIKVVDTPYVDEFVNAIFEIEESDDIKYDVGVEIGDWVYNSEVMRHRPLKRVPIEAVRVYRDVTQETFIDG